MAINREIFFTEFKTQMKVKSLAQPQVDGFNITIDEWESRKELTDLRWLAYMLGTKWWETARTMQSVAEYGRGKGRPYGSKIKHSGIPYKSPDKIYYGRGDVQLTWYENYELMGRLLGIDLLNQPELAMTAIVAVKVMFEGMLKGASSVGDFTGRCLEQYFNDKTEDWIGARKIINGKDKAEQIAQIAINIYRALIKAKG